MDYLNTGKMNLTNKEYVSTYEMLLTLSDETDCAEELYQIYSHILEKYISKHSYDVFQQEASL